MIKKIKNCYLIGTSHIAVTSVKEIKDTVESLKPKIVCVELDKNRFHALKTNTKRSPSFKTIREIGIGGFLFLIIGSYVQKKLGKKVNINPGADMLSATKSAKKIGARIALIDIPIDQTLKKFSYELPFKEKMSYIKEIFLSLIFPKKKMKELGIKNFNLSSVPSDKIITKLITYFKNHFPITYKILIDDRNKFMAKHILSLMESVYSMESKNDELENVVLVVIGAGHMDGIVKILEKNS